MSEPRYAYNVWLEIERLTVDDDGEEDNHEPWSEMSNIYGKVGRYDTEKEAETVINRLELQGWQDPS